MEDGAMEGTDLTWRKASYSSNGGGNCVEVADHGNCVLVRDTKKRAGPVLRFSPAVWRRFADQVKRSLLARSPARTGAALASEGRPLRCGGPGGWGLRGRFPRRPVARCRGAGGVVVLVSVCAGVAAVSESVVAGQRPSGGGGGRTDRYRGGGEGGYLPGRALTPHHPGRPGAQHAPQDPGGGYRQRTGELDEVDHAVRERLSDPGTLMLPHLLFLAWGRKPDGPDPDRSEQDR